MTSPSFLQSTDDLQSGGEAFDMLDECASESATPDMDAQTLFIKLKEVNRG